VVERGSGLGESEAHELGVVEPGRHGPDPTWRREWDSNPR
jgi:hypothetical protein